MVKKHGNRWSASILYHTPRKKDYVKFSEIKDLEKIVNLGPSWFEIDKIEISLDNPDMPEGIKAYKESIKIH